MASNARRKRISSAKLMQSDEPPAKKLRQGKTVSNDDKDVLQVPQHRQGAVSTLSNTDDESPAPQTIASTPASGTSSPHPPNSPLIIDDEEADAEKSSASDVDEPFKMDPQAKLGMISCYA